MVTLPKVGVEIIKMTRGTCKRGGTREASERRASEGWPGHRSQRIFRFMRDRQLLPLIYRQAKAIALAEGRTDWLRLAAGLLAALRTLDAAERRRRVALVDKAWFSRRLH